MTELRKFGYIFAGYYFAVLALILWHHHAVSPIAWSVLALVFAMTLIFPNALTPLKWLWDGVLRCLSYVNTRIIFGILFFAIFTPIALCKKIFGKDAMGLRYDSVLKTYRADCRDMKIDLERPY
ncbi:MAG: hypothetical protein ACD_70C00014G0003 [uncultured bacterium]|nr:MAG: hypothetical protein ACD_70C00014G0003 [uncultured bacterium]OGT52351.1 MAG: hypothetical protein A3E54_01835 [Gammaproteobacteria bacterium RIFCSPHIGHO2_12_FULL_41_25]OGT61962.1 MAG: hypothetical protein A3I77_01770 [Gammaproteobacteria bacterium RIFCSPLOWO2_02_FULL_42_14]OGT86326.1 MAG: hypothetical protein A3G86_07320 [Gammaproteobacteria bacterium RIFCSPLOWO2_12_FULL_42_18]